MTDLGMRFFLGIEVLQKSDCIFICQRKYTTKVLRRFRMLECVNTSQQLKLSRNPVMHARSRHIDVRCHFERSYKDGESLND